MTEWVPIPTPHSTGLFSSPFLPVYAIQRSLRYDRMMRTRYGGTLKPSSASIIPSQGMVLKAFVTSRETASATPFRETMASVVALTRFTAATVDRPRRNPSCLSCHPGARSVMWASRRAAIILSNSFPTSSKRYIGLYADGESKGHPSLFSRINLTVLHARGYTSSLRHLVNKLCRWGARVFIDSAQTRPGIPFGSGITSRRDAILFVAAKSSSWVTCSFSLHSMVSLRWEGGVRLVLPLSLLSSWFAKVCFFPGHPSCLWRRACHPSHPMVDGSPERYAQEESGCGGGTFSCTVSASAAPPQWTRM
jgi:hypothetical protein